MDSGYYPLKLSAASSSVEQDSLIVFIDTQISWEMAMLVKDFTLSLNTSSRKVGSESF